MNEFIKVLTVTAKHNRLYHPELYVAGDKLTVGLVPCAGGLHWGVAAYNANGVRVNRFINWSSPSLQYAKVKAHEFAETL